MNTDAYLLPDGSILHPISWVGPDGAILEGVEVAEPGSSAHKKWKPFAVPAPPQVIAEVNEGKRK
jgi:hypothetical protein